MVKRRSKRTIRKKSRRGRRKIRGGSFLSRALFLSRAACEKRFGKTAKSRAESGKKGIIGRTRHSLHKSICKRLYSKAYNDIKHQTQKATAELTAKERQAKKHLKEIQAEKATVKEIASGLAPTTKSRGNSSSISTGSQSTSQARSNPAVKSPGNRRKPKVSFESNFTTASRDREGSTTGSETPYSRGNETQSQIKKPSMNQSTNTISGTFTGAPTVLRNPPRADVGTNTVTAAPTIPTISATALTGNTARSGSKRAPSTKQDWRTERSIAMDIARHRDPAKYKASNYPNNPNWREARNR